jgi:hypothetical protein
MSERKVYLGDGAYADFDDHGIVLTAENGIRATDTVYLEPQVLLNLVQYAAKYFTPKMREAMAQRIDASLLK